jgi:hypothetical protein
MEHEVSNQQLRSFGLTVGGILAVLACWPLLARGENLRWWVLLTAAVLGLAGMIMPKALFWIYRSWMLLGDWLSWANTRILLGVVFYGVVTPTGAIRGWLGKDPMGRRLRPDLLSYRIVREPRPSAHLKKQY